jgi:all-trans-8'-apo-beta-carotenal 15,15'-oxygenase
MSIGLERCFLFDAVEDSYPITEISGRIPETLRGTHYVNGPARFRRGDFQYKHWLDGDGMICALRFSRKAHTLPTLHPNQEADGRGRGRSALYRGFGTAFAGDQLRGRSCWSRCQRECYPFAARYWRSASRHCPELDPVTLETRGEYDFHGKLNHLSPFAAHAKLDPSTGYMLNFGISYAADHPVVNVYEFDGRAIKFAGGIRCVTRIPIMISA